MPGTEFFARMAPEFAQHAGAARESASRQAELERMIAKAEYECYQLRRELVGVMAGIVVEGPGEGASAAGLIAAEQAVSSADLRQPAEAA